ncbi:hypothetical protein LCGC14_1093510 [marine sediment metagenome]|uniref:Uncharacterized protein n=1 Tax=marine sediment metagenome TaxID=412755 RepID=A0A0F9QHQ6_9ZZZZ
MVYKIKKCESFEDGICQHCKTWYNIIYRVVIESLYEVHTFDLCYGCFNWLHEEYDIEQ